MRNFLPVVAFAVFAALPAFGVEPGQAAGTLTVGTQKIPLTNSYAINRQKNEFTNRRDDIRIIATSKPLPDGTDLATVENAFPDGTFGVVICVDNKHAVSHVLVQFDTGMYDAGYFGPGEDYSFSGKFENKSVDAHLTSKTIKTSTTTFSYDVTVNAQVK